MKERIKEFARRLGAGNFFRSTKGPEAFSSQGQARAADRGLMQGFPPPPECQVTVENFQDAPFNRWGFRNVRALLPTAQVWRGEGPVARLEYGLRDLNHVTFEDADGDKTTLDQMLRQGYTDGFIVLHQGVVVMEHYDNDLTPHQPHLAMSVTKSVLGSLTGVLVDRGALSPDDLVTKHIPELSGGAYEGATVRNLLDMTVGIRFVEDYEDPQSDLTGLDTAFGWRARTDASVSDNARDFLKTLKADGKHGEVFHYASANSDVLGWLVERAGGLPFAELLAREIWQPMGAEFDAYVAVDRLGASQTDGGLCLTLRDLARFGQMHLQNGVIADRRVIPEAWIADIHENGDPVAWDKGSFAENMPGYHYRNKWYVGRHPEHCPLLAMGIYGQSLYIDPVSRTVIAKFSSHTKPVDRRLFDDMFRAFAAVCHALSGGVQAAQTG